MASRSARLNRGPLCGLVMVITLQDDNVLRVYETPEMAARDVEALDAEDVFRAVFAEAAQLT